MHNESIREVLKHNNIYCCSYFFFSLSLLLFVVSPCSFHLSCAFVLLPACASETDMLRKEAFPGAVDGQYDYINETADSEQVDFSVLHMRIRSTTHRNAVGDLEFVVEERKDLISFVF